MGLGRTPISPMVATGPLTAIAVVAARGIVGGRTHLGSQGLRVLLLVILGSAAVAGSWRLSGAVLGDGTAGTDTSRRRGSSFPAWVVSAVVVTGMTFAAFTRGLGEESALRRLERAVSAVHYRHVVASGTVVSEPRDSFGAHRLVMRVKRMSAEGNTVETDVYVLATIGRTHSPPVGARVRISGVLVPLREMSAAYWRRAHVVAGLRADHAEVVAPPGGLYSSVQWVRGRLNEAVSRALGAEDAALVLGLLIGDDSGFSPSLREDFRRAGMSHLTAVSGQNFSLVLGMAALVLNWCRRRLGRDSAGEAGMPWWSRAALVGVALYFGFLTRWDSSVMRAGAMAVLALCWGGAADSRRSLEVLSTSVAALLVVDPFLLDRAGFQLSVAATAGILLAGLGWARKWPGRVAVLVSRGLLGPLVARTVSALVALAAVSLAAQVFVTPVIFWRFGEVQVFGVISNLVAVPLAGIVSLVGFALAPFMVLAPDLAGRLLAVLAPALWLLRAVAGLGARLPQLDAPFSEAERGIIAGLGCCSLVLWSLSRSNISGNRVTAGGTA